MVLLVVVVVVVAEEDIEIHPLVFWLRWCDPEPDNIKLEGGWGGGRSASPPDAGVLAAEPVSFRRLVVVVVVVVVGSDVGFRRIRNVPKTPLFTLFYASKGSFD